MTDRIIEKKILEALKGKEILFLLGSRQVGKTTLAKMIMQKSSIAQKLYIDLEDRTKRELFEGVGVEQIGQILRLEGIDVSLPFLLVFDEVQKLNDPSNLLKLLHDHFGSGKIVASGSSSLEIKSKFSDSLAGRKKVFHIKPLCFDEFLEFRGATRLKSFREMVKNESDKLKLKALATSLASQFASYLEEYLVYGGYPEVALIEKKEDKIEKLYSIVDSYIQKDIRDIANIENIDGYNALLKYISINSGSPINISSLSKEIKLSVNTVNKYIQILKDTFIIGELLPYSRNKNSEISKNRKLYFLDSGARNLQTMSFNNLSMRSDVGELYESHVFNALGFDMAITDSLRFYRTLNKAEIDFLLFCQNGVSLYEVKSGTTDKKPKIFFEFAKKYTELNIHSMSLINRDLFEFRDGVWFLPIWMI
ncbi:MAG: ATP-binding protein [Campylobacterales bacterium]